MLSSRVIRINANDFEVLNNLCEKNNISPDKIINLFMNKYLKDLAEENHWSCDYNLKDGEPWEIINMDLYKPKTKEELQGLCNNPAVYLGDIDTSLITDMRYLFSHSDRTDFSGLEFWNVSQVEDMSGMFMDSYFGRFQCPNDIISNWDVSNVKDMSYMFAYTRFFNQDISGWDVSNVEDMFDMFCEASGFKQKLPKAFAAKAKYKNPSVKKNNPKSVR